MATKGVQVEMVYRDALLKFKWRLPGYVSRLKSEVLFPIKRIFIRVTQNRFKLFIIHIIHLVIYRLRSFYRWSN